MKYLLDIFKTSMFSGWSHVKEERREKRGQRERERVGGGREKGGSQNSQSFVQPLVFVAGFCDSLSRLDS